jgi:DnaD/phage-associated family protein
MVDFKGFAPDREAVTRIPASFFTQLLAEIEDIYELKVTLYALWRLDKTEGPFPYVTKKHFLEDEVFMAGFGEKKQAGRNLTTGLALAVERGTLLTVDVQHHVLYFLNSPRGQAAVQAIENGQWEDGGVSEYPIKLNIQRTNIFSLYENNIGPITPMIADQLSESENDYPAEWIEQAIKIAVTNNVRRWPYVEAILKNWQEEGRDDRTDQRRGKKTEEKYDPEKYTKGKFSDFIK